MLKVLNDFNQAHSKCNLREFFIVSSVELNPGPFKVFADKATGEKCVRCWVYSKEISKLEKTLGVCPKCVEALVDLQASEVLA